MWRNHRAAPLRSDAATATVGVCASRCSRLVMCRTQTWRSAWFNIHGRSVHISGSCYVRENPVDENSPLVFHSLPTPTSSQTDELAKRTAQRVDRILQKRGQSLEPEFAGDDRHAS